MAFVVILAFLFLFLSDLSLSSLSTSFNGLKKLLIPVYRKYELHRDCILNSRDAQFAALLFTVLGFSILPIFLLLLKKIYRNMQDPKRKKYDYLIIKAQDLKKELVHKEKEFSRNPSPSIANKIKNIKDRIDNIHNELSSL